MSATVVGSVDHGSSTILEELQSIRLTSGGVLLPSVVVESATDESSPLHRYFEWDDSVAATEHRLSQARALIRRCKVTTVGKTGPVRVRAFVSINEDSDRAYHDQIEVMSQPSLREQVIRGHRRALQLMAEKVRTYEEFAEVVNAVDKLQ